MTQPMTDERLAEIGRQAERPLEGYEPELLAEVKRLREREKVLIEACRGPVLTPAVQSDLEISAEIDEANGEPALRILLSWAARCRNLVKENAP